MSIPFRVRFAEWFAGALLVITVVAAVVALFFVSQSRGAFEARRSYNLELSDGHGIVAGADVQMLGIDIGRVESVEIGDDNRVQVKLDIRGAFTERIRDDSVVKLETSLGLNTVLGGMKITVTPGSPEAAILPAESTIPVEEPEGLADLLPALGAEGMVDDLSTVLTELRKLSQDVSGAKTVAGKMALDVALIIARLRMGQGTAGKVLSDSALYDEGVAVLKKAGSTLDEVDEAVKRIDRVAGKVGGAIDDADVGSTREALVKSFRETVDATKTTMEEFGEVLEHADRSMAKLGKAAEQFESAAKKLERVADSMEAVTKAASKSP